MLAWSQTATQPQTPPGMMPYTAILEPQFVSAAEAGFLQDDDIVIGVARGSVAKAFPAADLAQHGSVNDQMPDGPIEVTWCGVCNTGAVFRAKFKGRLLHFEYDSMVGANEVHKDHETGSRWQQSTGEAISGPLKGSRLELYPFVRTTWKEWHRRYPNTAVLKPLPGYDERMPNLSKRMRQVTLSGEGDAPKTAFGHDDRLRPKEVVAGLRIGAEEKAYPFSQLRIARVVNDRVGGVPVLVVHQPSSDTTTAFDARAKGKVLRFESADADASSLTDLETHSSWNAYGLSLRGPLKGTQLKALVLMPEFWFAWSEFHPQTKVFLTGKTPGAAIPRWETLAQAALPEDCEPTISASSIPMPPAPATPRPAGPGHRHAGPVFGYILQGEIENEVEPDPTGIYKTGDFFVEPTRHVHRLMRNRSQMDAANVIVFQACNRGTAAPAIRLLAEAPLVSAANQQARLRRLTLPPGGVSESPAHSNPLIVYVVEGKIDRGGEQPAFVQPASSASFVFRNASSTQPAILLLYEVSGIAVVSKQLLEEPLGETSESNIALSILTVAPGATVPSHSHSGAVFAYILQGDIENQVEPEPPKIYHPGGFFHERPRQVHRLLRNLSATEPAKLLIFQNTAPILSNGRPRLEEKLDNLANLHVTLTTLMAAPGATFPATEKQSGAVFAYVTKGEIESQVDAEHPKPYRAGDFVFAHGKFRNPSKTDPAELVIFQVNGEGQASYGSPVTGPNSGGGLR